MSKFKKAYEIIKANEGSGITNHKNDKGGITNSGLTYSFYAERCERVFNVKPSMLHFRKLSEEAKEALYFDLWTQLGIDEIKSDDIASFVFDFAVNSGQACRVIQETLKKIGIAPDIIVDNVFGSMTIFAINITETYPFQAKWLLAEFQLTRMKYLWELGMKDKSQRVFWSGWFRRVLGFSFKNL